jgi:hypothetical protein
MTESDIAPDLRKFLTDSTNEDAGGLRRDAQSGTHLSSWLERTVEFAG